jgi:hypothetical protein
MPVAVAATLGNAPRVGVGLFIVFDVIVATEDADDDRAGELGGRDEYGAGDNGGMDVGIILPIGVEAGKVGVGMEVGVGVPTVCCIGPVYLSPNSPGANMTTEQKPSVEVMSKVRPSDDL